MFKQKKKWLRHVGLARKNVVNRRSGMIQGEFVTCLSVSPLVILHQFGHEFPFHRQRNCATVLFWRWGRERKGGREREI